MNTSEINEVKRKKCEICQLDCEQAVISCYSCKIYFHHTCVEIDTALDLTHPFQRCSKCQQIGYLEQNQSLHVCNKQNLNAFKIKGFVHPCFICQLSKGYLQQFNYQNGGRLFVSHIDCIRDFYQTYLVNKSTPKQSLKENTLVIRSSIINEIAEEIEQEDIDPELCVKAPRDLCDLLLTLLKKQNKEDIKKCLTCGENEGLLLVDGQEHPQCFKQRQNLSLTK